MDEETKKILENHQQLLEAIYNSTEKTRKYILWTLVGSIVFLLLPLIAILLILPSVIDSITGSGLI